MASNIPIETWRRAGELMFLLKPHIPEGWLYICENGVGAFEIVWEPKLGTDATFWLSRSSVSESECLESLARHISTHIRTEWNSVFCELGIDLDG